MSTSNSSTEPSLLEVGRILKPHGLAGDLIVLLVTDRTERVDPGTTLSTPRGDVLVESSRRHQDRWIVHFRGISTRDEAEAWRGTLLLAAPIDDDEGTLWVHRMVGCTVISADGVERGRVVEVQANPASDLLVLDSGALVPLTFVVGAPTDGVIRVDVPTGLFELYE